MRPKWHSALIVYFSRLMYLILRMTSWNSIIVRPYCMTFQMCSNLFFDMFMTCFDDMSFEKNGGSKNTDSLWDRSQCFFWRSIAVAFSWNISLNIILKYHMVTMERSLGQPPFTLITKITEQLALKTKDFDLPKN